MTRAHDKRQWVARTRKAERARVRAERKQAKRAAQIGRVFSEAHKAKLILARHNRPPVSERNPRQDVSGTSKTPGRRAK